MGDRHRALIKYSGVAALIWVAASSLLERSAFGDGDTYGISVVLKPRDLEYYRKQLPPSLSMPENPLLAFFFMHVNLRNLRFMEAGVLLFCERDGAPGWAEVGVYVENPLVYAQASTMMGSKKLLCRNISLVPEGDGWRGTVKRFVRTTWSLEFKPMDLSEMGELEPWQRAGFEGRAFHPQITEPRFQVSKLRRKVSVLNLGKIFPSDASKQTGMVKVYVDPSCPWASLVESGSSHPGMFVKFAAQWDRIRETGNGTAG